MNPTLKANLSSHEQRSPEWFKAREGRFTASKATDLLTNGSRTMTTEEQAAYKEENPKGRRTTIDVIGDTALNLAIIAATEELIGVDEDDPLANVPDIKRGRELEPIAFKAFKELMELQFLDVVEVGFCKYGEHAGASLDGYVSDNSSLEIKCPRREKFFKILALGAVELDKKWIDQVQFQMMVCGTERCRFVIFYAEKGDTYLHEMIIERDETKISEIKARLDELIKLKLMFKAGLSAKLNF